MSDCTHIAAQLESVGEKITLQAAKVRLDFAVTQLVLV